jgi:hypothetical protein
MWAGSWGAPLILETINLMGALYTKKYALQKEFGIQLSSTSYRYILLIIKEFIIIINLT